MNYIKLTFNWIYEPKEFSRFEQISLYVLTLHALWQVV